MGNNIVKNRIAKVTYEKTLRTSPNKKAAKPLPYKPSPRGEGCDTRIPSSKKAAKPPPQPSTHNPQP